jgi:hypothetical protein
MPWCCTAREDLDDDHATAAAWTGWFSGIGGGGIGGLAVRFCDGGQHARACIRLTNHDVTDLYERVKVGAKVIVLPANAARRPSQGAPADAAFRLPDPGSPSKRPLAANAQMLSSGPKIAEAR